MFNGYRVGQHPVRAVHEVIRFITDGSVEFGDQKRCLWESSEFDEGDLVHFLGERHRFYSALLSALEPQEERWELEGPVVVRQVFGLNVLKAGERLGFDLQDLRGGTQNGS